jgi:hypothetical protein
VPEDSPIKLRIVRGRFAREWFVEQDGRAIFSLIEPNWNAPRWILRSRDGDWDIARSERYLLTATFEPNPTRTAEIRTRAYDPFAVTTYSDLYVDQVSYRLDRGGLKQAIRAKGDLFIAYSSGWRDADEAARVCYHIEEWKTLPAVHRDLVLVMPLFWSGMDMYDPISTG